MPEFNISKEKVAFIAVLAREFDAKVAPFDEGDVETSDEQERADGVLENRRDDPVVREFVSFVRALNEDEEAELVAVAWIGRGTYGPDEWDEAVATARQEGTRRTPWYLLKLPLLSEYLEEGMQALGIDIFALEDDLAGRR